MSTEAEVRHINKVNNLERFRQEFWNQVDRGEPDECWPWMGYRRPDHGYGMINVGDGSVHASRVAYELEVEPLGDGWVCHHCDNPPCVNPNHLYLGDRSTNTKDMFERGQKNHAGEHNPFSKLTYDQAKQIKERLADGETHQSIAEDFPVKRSAISHINNERRWPEA